jgi:hypothetical protein
VDQRRASIQADRDGQELRVQAAVTQTAAGTIGATNNGVLGIAQRALSRAARVVTSSGGSVQATAGVGSSGAASTTSATWASATARRSHIDTGGIVNNGTLTVNSNQGVNTTDLRFVAEHTVAGNGEDRPQHRRRQHRLQRRPRSSPPLGVTGTIGPDQSVTGKGRLTGTFINNGTINADRPAQDIRLIGTDRPGAGGTIMGSNGGFAVPEGVAITGGFFDGDTAAPSSPSGAATRSPA